MYFSLILILNLIYGSRGILITYYLFNRSNPAVPMIVTDERLVDPTKPLIVIIHPYLMIGLSNYCQNLKDEFLKNSDVNVIIYDWSQNNGDYERIVLYAKIAGKILGDQINYVFDKYDHIHLVGLGMGSHIAAFAAKQIKRFSNNIVRRISAVDPSKPHFNTTDSEERLSKNDATEVIVYHCDGLNLGIMEPLGTVDFYVNGGRGTQPGCNTTNRQLSFLETLYGNTDQMTCSHDICRLYYYLNINSNKTMATKCDSEENFDSGLCAENEKIVFGNNLPPSANGTYYLNITDSLDMSKLL